MNKDDKKFMELVSKMTLVTMDEHKLFASRKNIKAAEEYFTMLIEGLPKKYQFHMSVGLMVFWNTLAKNYVLFHRNPQPDIDEDVSAEIQMLKENK